MKASIKIHGKPVDVQFGLYGNDTVAIETYRNGEPYMVPTVNWESNWEGVQPYKKQFQFPVVVIKNYSENEGVIDDLKRQGVVQAGPTLSPSGGTVYACVLTEKWQEIAKDQLSKMFPKKKFIVNHKNH